MTKWKNCNHFVIVALFLTYHHVWKKKSKLKILCVKSHTACGGKYSHVTLLYHCLWRHAENCILWYILVYNVYPVSSEWCIFKCDWSFKLSGMLIFWSIVCHIWNKFIHRENLHLVCGPWIVYFWYANLYYFHLRMYSVHVFLII